MELLLNAGTVEQLPFPGGYHRGVYVEAAGQLCGGLFVGKRGQGHLSLDLIAFLAHL
jgi:hypothetical protein